MWLGHIVIAIFAGLLAAFACFAILNAAYVISMCSSDYIMFHDLFNQKQYCAIEWQK